MDFNSNIISILYGLTGLYTLYRLYVDRASFADHLVICEDINLTFMVAIFVLILVSVLAHEATSIELHHRRVPGFVIYSAGPGFDSSKVLLVSMAGPVVIALLAFFSIFAERVIPAKKIITRTLAFYSLVGGYHILIGFPLIDLFSGLEGDFHTMYSLLPLPGVALAGFVQLILFGLLILSWKRPPTRDLLSG